MEVALVSAATGALKPVMKKLAALMGDEYTCLKEVCHDIRLLIDELAGMHVFLLKMSEEEEPDAQDKVWMTAVWELSYDMEDSIDDFMQSVGDKDAKPDGFMGKIKHSMGELGKLKMHRQIGKDQRPEEHIIHVGDMNEWYKVGNLSGSYKSGMATSSINNATMYPRDLAIFEHDSKLIGIDEPKAELTKMLIQDGGCISLPQQIKIVSIVGPGGMGKTTLAYQVYEELKWQFTCQAFISISHNQNIMNILSTILSGLKKQDYVETEAGSIQHIISEIHDFLLQTRAIEDNFFTLSGVPIVPTKVKAKVRRLSLQVGRWGKPIIPTRDLVLSHARSLIVFGKSREIPVLDKFMHLRIMDFGGSGYRYSGNRELKNHHIENIGKLVHLRYLNLGGTGITELPQDIGCLQCLEMLDLRGTRLHVLPAGIVNLGKLAHLYMDCGVTFPEGIVKLQSLEVLQQISVFKQTFKFMEEIGQLMNLRMLYIDFEEHRPMKLWIGCFRFKEDTRYEDTRDTSEWEEPIASCFRGFVSMKNFHYLKIMGGGRFLPLGTLCPVPASLHKLILYLQDQPFSRVPEWMPSLVNLQELRIDVEGVTHNGLCILGSLPALLKLELVERYYNSEDRILTISGEVGFPYLTKFQYHTRSRGMDLKFAGGSMPKLEMLVFFTGNPYLYSSDTFGFDFGIQNLPSLVTLECRVSGDSRCFEAVVKTAASTHPNRVTVHFQKIHL